MCYKILSVDCFVANVMRKGALSQVKRRAGGIKCYFHSYNRTRNGLKYIFQLNLQIHFVSMNTKYSSLGDSLGHSDGLAVLGVFLKVKMFPSS